MLYFNYRIIFTADMTDQRLWSSWSAPPHCHRHNVCIPTARVGHELRYHSSISSVCGGRHGRTFCFYSLYISWPVFPHEKLVEAEWRSTGVAVEGILMHYLLRTTVEHALEIIVLFYWAKKIQQYLFLKAIFWVAQLSLVVECHASEVKGCLECTQ